MKKKKSNLPFLKKDSVLENLPNVFGARFSGSGSGALSALPHFSTTFRNNEHFLSREEVYASIFFAPEEGNKSIVSRCERWCPCSNLFIYFRVHFILLTIWSVLKSIAEITTLPAHKKQAKFVIPILEHLMDKLWGRLKKAEEYKFWNFKYLF